VCVTHDSLLKVTEGQTERKKTKAEGPRLVDEEMKQNGLLTTKEKPKSVSQLRFDYDTTTTRLQRKIDMFIFCLRRIGSRRARYVVVGS